jgi:site-specific DNA recombinase
MQRVSATAIDSPTKYEREKLALRCSRGRRAKAE